jgi:hypothetical protein
MIDTTTLSAILLLASASTLLIAAMLYPSALLRWFQRKRYQYEVTFSLYMLTSTEKFIFSTSQIPCPTASNRILNSILGHEPPPLSTSLCSYTDISSHLQQLLMNYLYRLRTLPPPLPPYNRRVAVPTRTPYHHRKPHVLLPIRQSRFAFE